MRVPLIPLVLAALMLGGCASSLSGSSYTRGQARVAQEVQFGTVESVREVEIEGTKSNVGAGAGAVAGSVVGRVHGNGPIGRGVGAVAGAVVGGIAGAAVEEGVTRQKGLEITVKLESGRYLAITQAADEDFKAGERVRVLSGHGTTRVTH